MITLEKFEASDIQRLIDWVPDADFLLQWSGPKYMFPLDEKQLIASLEVTRTDRPPQFMFKALLDGTPIGHIELMGVNYVEKSAVLARVLIGPKQYRGQGWGKMMIRLALHFAFEDLELEDIDLGVFAFNKSAIHCYQQFGFKIYKTIPNHEDEGWTLLRMNLNGDDWVHTKKNDESGER
ncbi:MAG: GNAT family N-acetyltransferase [FCB group bacterium]|nr:GNAT family N-acetyltransferase [FCB group bacterium]MBL7027183.1 GNAT family N-acetyltransferase [Candidatus Neomarinimicrobiota bacterium]MBL7120582.1 GNAT family N-acetyltransferase [Candidatus Neomarinimicrobiota bacterium]